MSATEFSPEMLVYFAEREKQRAEDLKDFKAGFTPRELSLMRDAAVMGYVQGRRHPEGEEHPKDSVVFDLVMDAIPHFADIYPCASGRCYQYSDIHPANLEEPK